MSMTVGELVAYLDLDDSRFQRGLDSSHSKFGALGKKLVKSAVAIAAAAGAALGGITIWGYKELEGDLVAIAQLEAGIASTGNVANVSSKGLQKLATAIQSYSGQTDDSIMQTESLLLTFTKIRNVGPDRIFDQATMAAANMAAKFGGDATASAIQLGKALNDPIRGVTALRRVGVQLSDEQEEQVKAFMKVNDVASAQKIILQELEVEFGGAAKAAGDSLPGQLQRVKRGLEDVASAAVSKLMPTFERLLGWVLDNMPRIERTVTRVFDGIAGMLSGDVSGAFGSIMGLMGVLKDVFLMAWPIIKDAVQMFVDFLTGPTCQMLIKEVLATIQQALQALLPVFVQVWGALKPVIEEFLEWFNDPERGGRMIADILTIIQGTIGGLQSIWEAAWPAIELALKLAGPVIEVVLWAIAKPLQLIADLIEIISGSFLLGAAGLTPITAGSTPEEVIENYKGLNTFGAFEDFSSQVRNPGSLGHIGGRQYGGLVTKGIYALAEDDKIEGVLPLTNRPRSQQLVNQWGLGMDSGGIIAAIENLTRRFDAFEATRRNDLRDIGLAVL